MTPLALLGLWPADCRSWKVSYSIISHEPIAYTESISPSLSLSPLGDRERERDFSGSVSLDIANKYDGIVMLLNKRVGWRILHRNCILDSLFKPIKYKRLMHSSYCPFFALFSFELLSLSRHKTIMLGKARVFAFYYCISDYDSLVVLNIYLLTHSFIGQEFSHSGWVLSSRSHRLKTVSTKLHSHLETLTEDLLPNSLKFLEELIPLGLKNPSSLLYC